MNSPIIPWKNVSVLLPVPHKHKAICERRGIVLCPDLCEILYNHVLSLDFTFEPSQMQLCAVRVDALFPEMQIAPPAERAILSLLNQREKDIPASDLRKLRRLHAGLDKNFCQAVDELLDGKPFVPSVPIPTKTYDQIDRALKTYGARPLSVLEMANVLLRLNLSDQALGDLAACGTESGEDSWWRMCMDSLIIRGEPRFVSVSQAGGTTRVQHNRVQATQAFRGSEKIICALAA